MAVQKVKWFYSVCHHESYFLGYLAQFPIFINFFFRMDYGTIIFGDTKNLEKKTKLLHFFLYVDKTRFISYMLVY